MTVIEQINRIKTNISNAYDVAESKGATMPLEKNSNNLANTIQSITTGGGGSSGKYLIQVIDYNGDVLKSERLDTGATFNLPNAPTHPQLVFQEWSSPIDIVNNSITVEDSDITIGATYKTVSGLTEIDITLTKVTGLNVTCKMSGNKNWGDGTEDDLTTHTYTDYGDYTITCDGTSIPRGSSALSGMFGSSSSNKNYYCTRVRIGELVTSIGAYAFSNCYSLTSITMPNSVTSIGSNAFYYCCSLTSITMPNSVTSIGAYAFYFCYSITSITIPNSVTSINYAFYYCYSLTSITIPNSVTSIGSNAFSYCYSLTSITIPNSVTSIGSNAFSYCCSLTSITMPNSVTSIGSNAFNSCYSITKYDFTSASEVPTLSNTNAFTNINGICKIYVPDALYDEWIVATNWATYADYIYKASEMEV